MVLREYTIILFNIFLLEINFDKSTIVLYLLIYIYIYIFHTRKIFRKLKINSYVINKLFKSQFFVV